MKLKKSFGRLAALLVMFFIVQITPGMAVDLQILGGFYDQSEYPGYQVKGTYKVELSKDNYSFTADQFEINISLPQQGAYDPSRAAEAVIPAGWELVLNSNTSMILRLLPGFTYSGSGAAVNRRLNFYIPIITSAPIVDNPSLVTVEWKDFFVDELPSANSNGSVLNVLDVNLPVTLVSFSASREGNTGQLTWSTTAETNSDRFEIERSGEGKTWSKIGKVVSNGESIIRRDYSFVDGSPLNGENLYRLKMIDKDASFAYSRIRSLSFEGIDSDLSVYPNPATNLVFVRNFENVTELTVNDLSGRKLPFFKNSVSSDGKLDLTGCYNGMYVINITRADGKKSSHKLLINK